MAIYLGTNKINISGLQPGNQAGYMNNAKLLVKKEYNFPLSNTNYGDLTISTTAQTLTLPATTYTTSPATTITVFQLGEDYDGTIIDTTEHDYVLIATGEIEYKYTVNDNTINTLIHGVKTGICRDQQFGKYHPILADTGHLNTTWTANNSYCTSQAVLLYKKVNGTYASTTSTGVYFGTGITSSISTSSGKQYMQLKLGSVSAKAHASYFPVDAMNYIDTTNTIIKCTWYVYEGDYGVYSRIYQSAYELAALN